MNINDTKNQSKIMEKLFPPHTPREWGGGGGVGLLGLPYSQEHLLMDAKLFSGTTKCRKDLFSENIPVSSSYNCMVSIATHLTL